MGAQEEGEIEKGGGEETTCNTIRSRRRGKNGEKSQTEEELRRFVVSIQED